MGYITPRERTRVQSPGQASSTQAFILNWSDTLVVAISIQWVTAVEDCNTTSGLRKHRPRSRTNAEFIHTIIIINEFDGDANRLPGRLQGRCHAIVAVFIFHCDDQ